MPEKKAWGEDNQLMYSPSKLTRPEVYFSIIGDNNMPLVKKASQVVTFPPGALEQSNAQQTAAALPSYPVAMAAQGQTAQTAPKRLGGTRKIGDKANVPMTKDDYWRRREERDVQRDKDMAWSGLAQAALDSVGLVQLNTSNTLEGFVELVVKATDLLLQARDKRNR
jgi:hypothetical protein